jgi:YihY family inner membrane protein
MGVSAKDRVDGLRDVLDRYQQQRFLPGFIYAVVKKFGDDEGGRHAALMAYYGFLSIFPVLLIIVATLSRLLVNDPELRQQLVNAIVPPQFRDVVYQGLASLPTSGLAFVIGAVSLFGAGLRIVTTAFDTVNHVAGVPFRNRITGISKWVRTLAMLIVLMIGLIAIGAVTVASQVIPEKAGTQRLGEFVGTVVMTFLLMWLGAALLLPRPPQLKVIWPAALIGSIAIAALLSFGSILLAHYITTSGPIYGSFATIVGLFAFIALISQALVWSAEVVVVRHYKLWPRGLNPENPTDADKRAMALLAAEQVRLPDQHNLTQFTSPDSNAVVDGPS